MSVARLWHRKGGEPRFVAIVADFFHAVCYAPRAEVNAAICANEFCSPGNRIRFHRTLLCFLRPYSTGVPFRSVKQVRAPGFIKPRN